MRHDRVQKLRPFKLPVRAILLVRHANCCHAHAHVRNQQAELRARTRALVTVHNDELDLFGGASRASHLLVPAFPQD